MGFVTGGGFFGAADWGGGLRGIGGGVGGTGGVVADGGFGAAVGRAGSLVSGLSPGEESASEKPAVCTRIDCNCDGLTVAG